MPAQQTSSKVLGYAELGPGDGPFNVLFPGEPRRLMFEENLDGVDAIVLWGGTDISPSLYGDERISNSGPKSPSERDLFEWELCRRAVEKKIPIIGVCRGAQLMCAFAGGKLIQDVTGHSSSHDIVAHTGEIFTNVSSSHHQMLYPFEVEHTLLAWSRHKLSQRYHPTNEWSINMHKPLFEEPEVVYFPGINGFAIQGHPEWHYNSEGLKFNTWVMEQIKQYCFKEST